MRTTEMNDCDVAKMLQAIELAVQSNFYDMEKIHIAIAEMDKDIRNRVRVYTVPYTTDKYSYMSSRVREISRQGKYKLLVSLHDLNEYLKVGNIKAALALIT